jgi:predicted AAA+ superfamily ATPase
MARTTLDIDTPLLEELKKLQQKEKKSLGALVSQLVAEALARRFRSREKARVLHWTTRAMGARVDITDKEALYAALDEGKD